MIGNLVDKIEYQDSRYLDITKYLYEQGFDVRPPSSTTSEAKQVSGMPYIKDGKPYKGPYIIVMNGYSSKPWNASITADRYVLYVCVPEDRYDILDSTVMSVREAMKGLFPMLRQDSSFKFQSYFDDAMKAHVQSLTYRNYKKVWNLY